MGRDNCRAIASHRPARRPFPIQAPHVVACKCLISCDYHAQFPIIGYYVKFHAGQYVSMITRSYEAYPLAVSPQPGLQGGVGW